MSLPARSAAMAVHAFTAAGVGIAFMALLAAIEKRWTAMFVWLAIALVVDGIDGPLARRAGTSVHAARFSGDILDLVVDFLTYVFVPTYALYAAGLLPPQVSLLAVWIILITGAVYFADTAMKTDDNFFRGFPGIWNLLIFYLFALRLEPWLAFAVVLVMAVGTFVPIKVLHPLRVRKWRSATLAACAAWLVLAGIALWYDLAPPAWVAGGLVALAVYFTAVGLSAGRASHAAP